MKPLTKEQEQLRGELIERFGLPTFNRAWHMAALRNCVQALACDELKAAEREEAYTMACMHLAQWQATYMTTEESAKLTECARRIDTAIDLWTLDGMEERDGLPPSACV